MLSELEIHSCLTVLFIILVAGGCEELNHPETQEHPDSDDVTYLSHFCCGGLDLLTG